MDDLSETDLRSGLWREHKGLLVGIVCGIALVTGVIVTGREGISNYYKNKSELRETVYSHLLKNDLVDRDSESEDLFFSMGEGRCDTTDGFDGVYPLNVVYDKRDLGTFCVGKSIVEPRPWYTGSVIPIPYEFEVLASL